MLRSRLVVAWCWLLAVACGLFPSGPRAAFAQAEEAALPAELAATATAPVRVDGLELFQVRGSSAFPAEVRARAISERIGAAARDPKVSPDSLRIVPVGLGFDLVAGEHRIMTILDADAQLEQLDTRTFGLACRIRVQQAIREHRLDRDPGRVLERAGLAVVVGLVLAVVLVLIARGTRRAEGWLAARCQLAAASVQTKTFDLVRIDRVWWLLRSAMSTLRVLLIALLVYLYLNWGLALFPWTRLAGRSLLKLVSDPVRGIVDGVVGYLPELVFLIVLFLVARWSLRLVGVFFGAVGRGTIVLRDFEPEWALPTFRIVRFLLVALFVVVAYPYIPGSDSGAFKGVSLLLGLLVSLGSSSIVANFIAGYTMIYRRAFKIGDRIRVGEHFGDVVAIRPLAVSICTPKNEEIVIPNAEILNNAITNYSTLVRQGGLLLHTTVRIGYEVPWRQVETMLLLAAGRAAGLIQDTPAFVLQTGLGDCAVEYELNVACGDAREMARLYSALHRNILDVFNEYGVQIMTPSYEGDPESPKVVPPERWFAAPATDAPGMGGAHAPAHPGAVS